MSAARAHLMEAAVWQELSPHLVQKELEGEPLLENNKVGGMLTSTHTESRNQELRATYPALSSLSEP